MDSLGNGPLINFLDKILKKIEIGKSKYEKAS